MIPGCVSQHTCGPPASFVSLRSVCSHPHLFLGKLSLALDYCNFAFCLNLSHRKLHIMKSLQPSFFHLICMFILLLLFCLGFWDGVHHVGQVGLKLSGICLWSRINLCRVELISGISSQQGKGKSYPNEAEWAQINVPCDWFKKHLSLF